MISNTWKRTSRPPLSVKGYEWLSYQTGIANYVLHCAALSATVSLNFNRATYSAYVNGQSIGHLYRTETAAILAAINEGTQQ